ncbi:MAG: hypothetical protein K940chlam3_01509 [Chlamydiae bacterium]|nr:hypothetical protein [Chlamydiota bacterium]
MNVSSNHGAKLEYLNKDVSDVLLKEYTVFDFPHIGQSRVRLILDKLNCPIVKLMYHLNAERPFHQEILNESDVKIHSKIVRDYSRVKTTEKPYMLAAVNFYRSGVSRVAMGYFANKKFAELAAANILQYSEYVIFNLNEVDQDFVYSLVTPATN